MIPTPHPHGGPPLSANLQFLQTEQQTVLLILIATTLVLVAVLTNLYLRQRRTSKRLRNEREAIKIEETRMFDFLHGLGEAMHVGGSTRAMHRHIVEGIIKVVRARGGILYLFNEDRTTLLPTFVSKKCPALIPLTDEVQKQISSNPRSLQGYMQLQQLNASKGVAAKALASERCLLDNELRGLTPAREGMLTPEAVPAMIAPLNANMETFGLLAVSRGPLSTAFTKDEFTLFQSIAEQSAFALASAMVFKEAAEKRQLENELRLASEIQRILVPEENPEFKGYTICGINTPARYVSGDYFDFIALDPYHLGVVIADVSGKGIAASLITAMCRSVLRLASENSLSPSQSLAKLNRLLFPDIREDMFISLAYLILDSDSGRVTIARAGHDAPLLYKAANGSLETVQSAGIALGIDPGDVFERVTKDHVFHMEQGDILLLYTDGVNEAINEDGEDYGLDRLREFFTSHAKQGARQFISLLQKDLRRFSGEQPQSDDITLIAIEKQ